MRVRRSRRTGFPAAPVRSNSRPVAHYCVGLIAIAPVCSIPSGRGSGRRIGAGDGLDPSARTNAFRRSNPPGVHHDLPHRITRPPRHPVGPVRHRRGRGGRFREHATDIAVANAIQLTPLTPSDSRPARAPPGSRWSSATAISGTATAAASAPAVTARTTATLTAVAGLTRTRPTHASAGPPSSAEPATASATPGTWSVRPMAMRRAFPSSVETQSSARSPLSHGTFPRTGAP